jgi:hypothetical protein
LISIEIDWKPTSDLLHKIPPRGLLSFLLNFCLSLFESVWHTVSI